MDSMILRKFLKAGVIRDGELFATDQGISLGASLSPIFGNMILDGLQSFIYDRLYPNGNVDYQGGCMTRFADDMIILARSKGQADLIWQIISEFLSMRGLEINTEKSKIVNIYDGFDFVSWHFQRKQGYLTIEPSENSLIQCEHNLEKIIMDTNSSYRTLIRRINGYLSGWANYHRSIDAYHAFRRIDTVVESLLVDKMLLRHPSWHKETVLNKFWVKDGENHIFILPEDPSVRVVPLAPLPIRQYKPCKLDFNFYLDKDYYIWLQHRRNIQRVSGKYRTVWNHQEGKCYFCDSPMLSDQDVEIIEKKIGQGILMDAKSL